MIPAELAFESSRRVFHMSRRRQFRLWTQTEAKLAAARRPARQEVGQDHGGRGRRADRSRFCQRAYSPCHSAVSRETTAGDRLGASLPSRAVSRANEFRRHRRASRSLSRSCPRTDRRLRTRKVAGWQHFCRRSIKLRKSRQLSG